MKEPLFRTWLVVAAIGVASMPLTACGGGSDDEGSLATEPQARSLALSTSAATSDAGAQRQDDALAADDGATRPEPK